jgi:hypothetical protein
MRIDEFLNRLEGVKAAASGWMARCPGHDDRKASLSIADRGGDGGILLHCQAGCETSDVVQAMGLTWSDLFVHPEGKRSTIVATYDYRDENGALLYQVVRFEPKDFRQRKPEGGGWVWSIAGVRRVLYRLPELLAAGTGHLVFIPEGERDVETLRAFNFTATTNVGGAGKWKPEYSEFLRGRHVVLLPDNDTPGRAHVAQVAAALTGIAASVRVLTLPGLPEKGDVSDWFRVDGNAYRLLALANDTPSSAAVPSSRYDLDAGKKERQERIELGRHVLSFGVRFLDDALGGIGRRDLVLVGAKTGVGKTQLATNIGMNACAAGKQVHYFGLEAEQLEIERRMKYQIVADLYYANRGQLDNQGIRYLDWLAGRIDHIVGRYEEQADVELARRLKNLTVHYSDGTFTADDFCDKLESIKASADLIILDHLHYVEIEDQNENRGYKRAVKQIRNSALLAERPVVVVAHVRKGDRRFEALLPSIEDFHGSSDVPKIATKAIMLAPADVPQRLSYLWSTYMQISKCRADSSLTRYVALTTFNARQNRYENDYILGKLAEGGKSFAVLPYNDMPKWADGSTNAGAETRMGR